MSKEAMKAAVEAPLIEQLRSVPADAVLKIDTPNALGCMDTSSIPVGALCHRAASALLRAALEGGEEPSDREEAKLARPPSDEEPWVVADDTGLRLTFRDEASAWRYRDQYTDRLVNPTVTHEPASPIAAAGEEPIAWMKRTNVSSDWDAYDFAANPSDEFCIPLYRRPIAADTLRDATRAVKICPANDAACVEVSALARCKNCDEHRLFRVAALHPKESFK